MAFNESLNVPIKWMPEVKESLSGLSANSNGCGTKRNTVWHIYLLEDYEEGRLKRKANSFLCNNSKSKWGADWSGRLGSYKTKEIRVSCKQCLTMAER